MRASWAHSGGLVADAYDGTVEIEQVNGETLTRTYVDDIAVIKSTALGTTAPRYDITYTLRDRLGSVVTLTNHHNLIMEHRSYDPFGKPRYGTMQASSTATLLTIASGTPFTQRGFTDHEHIDEAQLIHMNGRVYDYNLGRFLSVDPFIQAPGNSQSLNPYSYIMNNPLAGTDPSGYIAKCVLSIHCDSDEPINGRRIISRTQDYAQLSSNGNEQQAQVTNNQTEASEIGSQNYLNALSLDDVTVAKDWEPKHLVLADGTVKAALSEGDRKLMYLIDNAIDAHIATAEEALKDPNLSETFRREVIEGLKHLKSAELIYSNKDEYPRGATAIIESDGSGAEITFYRSASAAMGEKGKAIKAYGVEIRTGYGGIKDTVNHEVGHLIRKNTYVTRKDNTISSLRLPRSEAEDKANNYMTGLRPYELEDK